MLAQRPVCPRKRTSRARLEMSASCQLLQHRINTLSAQSVLCTTGYTRNAVVPNGMLDEGTILLTQPLSTEELVLKISRAAPP
jgi:prolyl-tRNA editing enzyme YbaK/EbsC (Cys-tRNA(Pro) deacylase)